MNLQKPVWVMAYPLPKCQLSMCAELLKSDLVSSKILSLPKTCWDLVETTIFVDNDRAKLDSVQILLKAIVYTKTPGLYY